MSEAPVGPDFPVNKVRIPTKFVKIPRSVFALIGKVKAIDAATLLVYEHLYIKSWGFGRNWVQITDRALAGITGLARASVQRALGKLIDAGLLGRHEIGRKGTTFVVYLPAGSSYVSRDESGPDSGGLFPEGETSGVKGTSGPASEQEISGGKSVAGRAQTPEGSGRDEMGKLRIETKRWPRKCSDWRPWGEIYDRLQDSVPHEDLICIPSWGTMVARGLGRSIHVRARNLTPEVISDALREALRRELLEYGIDTIWVAV